MCYVHAKIPYREGKHDVLQHVLIQVKNKALGGEQQDGYANDFGLFCLSTTSDRVCSL